MDRDKRGGEPHCHKILAHPRRAFAAKKSVDTAGLWYNNLLHVLFGRARVGPSGVAVFAGRGGGRRQLRSPGGEYDDGNASMVVGWSVCEFVGGRGGRRRLQERAGASADCAACC